MTNRGQRAGWSGGARLALLGCTALVSALQAMPARAGGVAADALPIGGQVTAGAASIGQTGTTLTVTQSSDKAILSWNRFDVGSAATVTFRQPSASSMTLNRIGGGTASDIEGALNANGTVILINPNGVVFGGGAQVNVGGLVASTMDIADQDFLAGKLAFKRGGATGTVENKGSLKAADGGSIALLAARVKNEGLIQANLGTVALAAGDAVTLTVAGSGMSVKVDPATVQAEIDAGGIIRAGGGTIYLTAKAANSLLGGAINATGTIAADSLQSQGGQIVLDASGPIALNGATLTATGAIGGGTVTVGNAGAASVAIDAASTIDASAAGRGNGGAVTVNSRATIVRGTIRARGGANGGNGGRIETSGDTLDIAGATIDAGAPKGTGGLWLLDPYDLTVNAADATSIAGTLNGGTSVTLQTSASGTSGAGTASAGAGDIILDSALTWTASSTLTLDAYHGVTVNAPLSGTNLVVKTNDGGTGGLFTANEAVTPSSSLTINGNAYTLVTTASGLAGVGTSGDYALASDLTLSGSFTPIGYNSTSNNSSPTAFTGIFEGLGHTVSGLTVTSSSANNLGLFSQIGSGGTVENLTLANASLTSSGGYSYAGVLAGQNFGTIYNSSAAGTVVAGVFETDIAGLVGKNLGTISASYASGSVSVGSQGSHVGGLVGENDGLIAGSHAANTVSAGKLGGSIGGLAGVNNAGTISSSYATGAVTTLNANYVGGLAGANQGVIAGSYATNSVAVGESVATEAWSDVGGLLGYNSGNLSGVYATGNVTGVGAAGTSSYVGALIGVSDSGSTISASYATGNVSVTGNVKGAGGLVGEMNFGRIAGSHATGNVSVGNGNYAYGVGGLVGDAGSADISASYATGAVSVDPVFAGVNQGRQAIGGLVGDFSTATITNSYATGDVAVGSFANWVGGLVGYNRSTISGSYAVGNVTVASAGALSSADIGGLVGYNQSSGTLVATYATGSVGAGSGNSNVGGLVGLSDGTGLISASYATGAVSASGSTVVGGLVGNNQTSIAASYWDSTTTGTSTGVGSGTATGATGLTTRQWLTLGPVAQGLWDTGTWQAGSPYPVLKALPYLVVTGSASQTYGTVGSLAASITSVVDQTGTSVTSGYATTGLSWLTSALATSGVGTYVLGGSGVTDAGYQIAYTGSATVTPAALTVTASGAAKTYGTTANPTGYSTSGLVNGDSVTGVTLASSGAAATALVGSYGITASGATGTGLANYTITYVGGTLTVSPAALTVTASDAAKTYGDSPALSGFTTSGLTNGDSVTGLTLASTGTAATAGVGTYTITASGATGSGLANYTITYVGGTLTVAPKALTVTANGVTKIYGGTATAGGYTVSGLVNSDSVSGATVTAAGGTAATGAAGSYAIDVANATGSGLSNYAISYVNGTLTVTPKALTITAGNGSKVYGSTASLTGYTVSGLVNSDSVAGVTLASSGAAAGAGVGSYAVTGSGATGSGLSNYAISYVNGTLAVTPASLTITAADAGKTFGMPRSLSGFTASGLVNGDSVTSLSLTSPGTDVAAPIGSYAITAAGAGGAGLSNYTIRYVNGTLTVAAGSTGTSGDLTRLFNTAPAAVPVPAGQQPAPPAPAGVTGSTILRTDNTGQPLLLTSADPINLGASDGRR